VRDSLSNLGSGDSASSLDHLLSNFSRHHQHLQLQFLQLC
jgi:hypothetical protein